MRSQIVDIAGLDVKIQADRPGLIPNRVIRAAGTVPQDVEPIFTFNIFSEKALVEIEAKNIAGPDPEILIKNDRYCLYVYLSSRIAELYCITEQTEDMILERLNLACHQILPLYNATFLHASAVCLDHGAAIFCGPSGAGKSTIKSHVSLNGVISDDIVAVRHHGPAGVKVHTVPFDRIFTKTVLFKTGAIFFPEKADGFGLSPVRTIDAVERLWDEQSPFLRYILPYARQCLSLLYLKILSTIPVYVMKFQKDFVDWEKVDAAMCV